MPGAPPHPPPVRPPAATLRDLVIGVSPFGEPNARLVASVCGAGGLGVLDLGAGDHRAREALGFTARGATVPFGVRVGTGCALGPTDLPPQVDTVLLGADLPWQPATLLPRLRVLVEVTGVEEARRAARQGAHGLVARGHEAGGRVGELGSFVLLQRLLGEEELSLPVWVWGGVGLRVAAAAVVGGAAGVVLDSQLALLAESDLADDVRALIATMDGSETVVVAGDRVLLRRGRGGAGAAADRTEASTDAAPGAPHQGPPSLDIGQDGFLAKRFAERHRGAGGAVRAVRASILEALRDDSAGDTLRAGSPLARALRIRLPVAQGPMTRVSDRARFAAAVAEHGAMPFVALALADREQTRTLLHEARAALGDRPWGVGVLGFAPDEIRAAQLEVIREVRPSCAVIAGGRPAQAAALEEAGIASFLHVPSPGLLRQFLDAGARRFVFEGSECGGHVGPRSSFALWEAQLAVLDEFLDGRPGEVAAEVQALFAGGIHDERSAAMVAVLAAPLARRGAGVGVLMGTAYLFTEEAVACDAIQALFQRELREADRTELLETAPGHVTRCLASPFASSFRAIKSDLRARAVPDRQMWEELERLNLGRLRIASKGVQRISTDLVAVDEGRQLAEGLFMAGQVAVLRSQTMTIAGLHAAVSDGAADFLDDRTSQLRGQLGAAGIAVGEPPAAPPLDVAIVGMACVFPGSPDLAGFWANVVAGADLITEVPAERWDPGVYYSPEAAGTAGERTLSKWGGFLPRVPFDALRYGIPPASLSSIEPVQLLALEVAQRALVDAGYGKRDFDRSRTAVVFGAEAGSDLSNATVLRTLLPAYLDAIPAQLADQLPRLTEDSFPGMLSNVIAGRIANRLDLGGASYTVDAACASSLAALDAACKELAAGASDLVLCGGADLHNAIHDYLLFASVGALSPTGRCRAFDGSADGIVLGEGVACVALKRLADAERDGDRVYAVIKGVGSASDGRSVGLTAPRPDGQRSALRRAYRNADVPATEVGLIEAHGTATAVGDHTELTTLTTMFAEAGAAPGDCALGSVKSQIGHTKCAAGLAGLIKAALAVHTGVRPPTLHLDEPNPLWQPQTSPFSFFREARPWAVPPADRVAGVSAFGFGGTNFHVVVRAHDATPTPRHSLDEWPAELFTFRGADHDDACRSIERLLELIATNDAHRRPWRLRDLARTVSRRSDQRDDRVRVAIVAADLDGLTELLHRAVRGEHAPGDGLFVADGRDLCGKLAVLFVGQGSQRPGMLAELFVAFPGVQQYLQLGRRWADALFPPAAFDDGAARAQAALLRDTRFAQPALGVVGLAVNHLLTRLDVRPDMLAGHSYGELVALCCAGAFDPATLLHLSEARAEAILAEAGDDPGTMAAVSATAADVERTLHDAGLGEHVVVANHNAPRQVVISGPTAAIERAIVRLRAAGHASTPIAVACAFHSPLIAGACPRFAHVLAGQLVWDLEMPVWSNRTAARYPRGAAGVRSELVAQLGAPVRFVEQVEAMYADGARVFFEAGPGTVLTRAVGAILDDRPHVAVACEGPTGSGLPGFLGAVAQLAIAGVALRTGWLFGGRDAADVSTATAPQPCGWTVDGQVVRTVDGAGLPGGLAAPRRVAAGAANGAAAGAAPRHEELVAEFLRTSREIVAAQRDVLLSYLGPAHAAPEGAAPPAAPQAVAEDSATPVAPPPAGPTDVLHAVLEIISERTGYPVDMIEPDLDLEADLSIDSIKRTEIVGELAIRLGVAGSVAELSDVDLSEPAQARTAGAIARWLDASKGCAVPAPATGAGQPATSEPASTPAPPKRFMLRSRALDAAAADASVLAGTRFAVFGGGRVAAELAAALSGHDAAVSVVERARPLTDADDRVEGVIYLDALAPADGPLLPDAFAFFQAALARGPRWLLAACELDARNGRPSPRRGQVAGLRGLFRTVASEHPEVHAALVEFDPAGSPAAIAAVLVDELLAADHSALVQHVDGNRHALHMVETPLLAAGDGAAATGDGAAAAAALGLHADSVVLLVGGARGITAHLAAALAAASSCRLELVGRTPLPAEPEDPTLAAAGDRPALRAALVELGHRSTSDVERTAGGILAQREILATIAELRALGSAVRYHALDARDRTRMRLLVEQIEAEHGRLDGAVYAAGVIDDRLLLDKDQQSFSRVFNTKVDGAAALLDAVEDLPDRPRFVVLFGSISAVVGNRGQADYAAANDALESLGASWATRTGRRALTVHWGPWAPDGGHAGMVTPELQMEYGRRGIALIDPREGPLCLLRELAWGEPSERAVVYAASAW